MPAARRASWSRARFRKDVAEQVKGELLMDSLTQINEEQKLSAISEPDFDLEAVEMPDEGPMTFEFDIEVRPEFEMPQVEGADDRAAGARVHRRPTSTSTLQSILARRGRLVPFDGPAAAGRLHHHEPDVQARRRGACPAPRKK